MSSQRDVPPDIPVCESLDRKGKLLWLMSTERRVKVTNPTAPGSNWTGTIIGMIDTPAMMIEMDDGRRWALPQCFAVEDLSPPKPRRTSDVPLPDDEDDPTQGPIPRFSDGKI